MYLKKMRNVLGFLMQKFALNLSYENKKMKVSLHSVTNNRSLEIHMDSKS